MMFSPAYLSALIVEPLRYFFSLHGGEDLTWDPDPKVSHLEIDTINNYNKEAILAKPRILITRGQYSLSPTGLNDNFVQNQPFIIPENKGTKRTVNMIMAQGVAQVMVEARNEGTCEKLVDFVQHFLAWSGPIIASTHGFKNFAQAINVSPCTPSKDDTEIFQCTFNIPWSREEHWLVNSSETIALKNFISKLNDNDDREITKMNGKGLS